MIDKSLPQDTFIVGRPLMTCCADESRCAGLVCEWPGTAELSSRDWVEVTATISVRKHECYGRIGPVLYGVKVQKTEALEQEVASFY